uniref:Uncharacterized protein n=1 Tax=Oryza sativa subsp. japonica TaxID=39947 RepID=Q6Z6T9_ORYSJ|nr:hypothetical protein [Oryza sativa Japonica Group]
MVAAVTLLISTGCASVEPRYHVTTSALTRAEVPRDHLGINPNPAAPTAPDWHEGGIQVRRRPLTDSKPALQNRVNIKHTTIAPPDSTYRKEKS